MENLLRVKLSAPGKVILHGEHSVVYGKPAIVAAIGARNHLTLQENDTQEINFHFEGFNKHCKIPLSDVNGIFSKLTSNGLISEKSKSYLTLAEEFVNDKSSYFKDFQEEQHKKSITAVLYLLLGILHEEGHHNIRNGFSIEVTSEIDLGAGLGSSASFAVCFAAAFLCISRSEEIKEAKCFSLNWKEIISKWAFNSEKIMHGKPSGIDNTICTYGGLLKFQKEQPFSPVSVRSSLQILLVNSKIPRSTSKMVQKVVELKTAFPNVVDNIFNAMEEVAKEASKIYENFSMDDENAFNKIKILFQINNDLLRSLGVSHEKLDRIAAIASTYGYQSKITGAGGGGYMIILLPQNYRNSDEFVELCNDLQKEGFEWKEEIAGGNGVDVEIL